MKVTEFELIDALFAQQPVSQHGVDVGIGDDAAVICPPKNKRLVVCADTLIQGRHFTLKTSPFSVGYKLVAVNLSDLAAMAATPHSILLALSVPNVDLPWLKEFRQGLMHACKQFNVMLVGGDTTQSQTMVFTVTAIGFADQVISRSGANPGDKIAISGTLGDAAYALKHDNSLLQHRLDMPTPRVKLGQMLADHATAMIDVSDGLLQDLTHVLKASGVSAKLAVDKLPTSEVLNQLTTDQRLLFQLSGGDDYELVFTYDPHRTSIEQLRVQSHTPITTVGDIVKADKDGDSVELLLNNQYYPKPEQMGYQHF